MQLQITAQENSYKVSKHHWRTSSKFYYKVRSILTSSRSLEIEKKKKKNNLYCSLVIVKRRSELSSTVLCGFNLGPHTVRDHVHVEDISFNEEKFLALTQSTETINQSKQMKLKGMGANKCAT